jgi:hypothetical protein
MSFPLSGVLNQSIVAEISDERGDKGYPEEQREECGNDPNIPWRECSAAMGAFSGSSANQIPTIRAFS